jgi:hypothetical protein
LLFKAPNKIYPQNTSLSISLLKKHFFLKP